MEGGEYEKVVIGCGKRGSILVRYIGLHVDTRREGKGGDRKVRG